MILQANLKGIVLKSAAHTQVVMTRCYIKKDFFNNDSYQIEVNREEDKKRIELGQADNFEKQLIEFCLPFGELKQIVDGIVEEENMI
mgnify:CR=1 FL=1